MLLTKLLILIIGALGVAALTMTGMENSMAGAVRMVEEGTDAAEACVGTAVRAIRMTLDDAEMDDTAAVLLAPESYGHPGSRLESDRGTPVHLAKRKRAGVAQW